MLFHTMSKYPRFIEARLNRLRAIAEEMNRSAIWTADHDLAEEENRQTDRDLMIQSLQLA